MAATLYPKRLSYRSVEDHILSFADAAELPGISPPFADIAGCFMSGDDTVSGRGPATGGGRTACRYLSPQQLAILGWRHAQGRAHGTAHV